jgi:hypothetical protein
LEKVAEGRLERLRKDMAVLTEKLTLGFIEAGKA